MVDFQLLNRQTNRNADLASSSSGSTLHPQRSYRNPGCPECPWSAAGAHCNEASSLFLTCYTGKMLRSYGRHTSLIGSSFPCINYPEAGKKTESWPEIRMIECVGIYVLCQATGFPYIFTRLHCFREDVKKINIVHYLWWSIEPEPGQSIYNHTSILMKNSTD